MIFYKKKKRDDDLFVAVANIIAEHQGRFSADPPFILMNKKAFANLIQRGLMSRGASGADWYIYGIQIGVGLERDYDIWFDDNRDDVEVTADAL